MAISVHRKSHASKVAERYKELVEMRLEAGQTRAGFTPRNKNKPKRTPHRNPERVNLNKSQKRVAKLQRRLARELAAQ